MGKDEEKIDAADITWPEIRRGESIEFDSVYIYDENTGEGEHWIKKSFILEQRDDLAARVEELQSLLAEALEYIQDPDDYSPYERGSLENKIKAGLVPAEEE